MCRERGKTVQIHHIDEDPTNHSIENLAVLCFEDHERTQIKGGFGRKLLGPEVRRYRDDWIERVKKRREEADRIMIAAMGGGGSIAADVVTKRGAAPSEWEAPPRAQLVAYIEHLPRLRREAYENARYGWDTGVTSEMRRATSEVIDIMERVLVYLASWYPPDQFSDNGSAAYFSNFVSDRFHWHRALQEPGAPGSGGTLAGVLAGGDVLTDIETAVVDLVKVLSAGDVDLVKWHKEWEKSAERPVSLAERIAAKWRSLSGRP